nr:MAG TPA: hypothetical protein [Caudoviricetes sp.]
MFKNILNIKAVGTNIQNTNANIKLADTLMNGSHTAISQQFKDMRLTSQQVAAVREVVSRFK